MSRVPPFEKREGDSMTAERSAIPGAVAEDDRGTIRCHDPATLEHLGEVPVMAAETVRAVVERGRRAQPAWAETSFAERRRVLET
ncbi:MAG: aldehyde dehydrogenase family protein, partial [Polyangiales bacterium]